MTRKRNRGASGGMLKWDSMPWKSIEPTLQPDDGWQSTGGEDQALLYSLEEISGGDYALQCASGGGTQMVIARDESPEERTGSEGAATRSAGSPAGEFKGVGDGGGEKKGKGGHKESKKRKASPENGGGAESAPGHAGTDPSAAVAAAATASVTSIDPRIELCVVAEGVGEGEEADSRRNGGNADAGAVFEARPRRKRRRGQGGKNKKNERRTEADVEVGERNGAAVADMDGGSSGLDRARSFTAVSGQADQERSIRGGSGGGRGVADVEDSPAPGCAAEGYVRVAIADDCAASSRGAAPSDAEQKEKLQLEQQQHQHAGEGTAEDGPNICSQSDGGDGGGVRSNSEKRKKKKKGKKKKKNMAKAKAEAEAEGEEREGGTHEGRSRVDTADGRRNRWDLSVEDSAKMLPWLYLGVELHPALLWHLHRQGFYDPTPIQERVLPKAILGRKDIIGAAETGSGKTLAFGLPILNDILTCRDAVAVDGRETKEKGEGDRGASGEPSLQALVLCPTRELALQVAAHFREVVRDTGLAVVVVVGGLAEVKQERQLSRRPEVVVATPGRFWELARTHTHLSRLENLRHLVVDEADRMLERGHYPELKKLFSALERVEGRAASAGFDLQPGAREGTEGKRGKHVKREGSDHGNGYRHRHQWSMPPLDEEDPASWPEGGANSPAEWDRRDGAGMTMDGSDGDRDKGDDNDDDWCRSPSNDARMEVTATMDMATRVAPPATTSKARGVSPRQTYVFSATLLTRGSAARDREKRGRKVGGARGSSSRASTTAGSIGGEVSGDGADPVANIMKRLGVRGNTAVIDMGKRTVSLGKGVEGTADGGSDAEPSKASSSVATGDVPTPALPSTLRLCSIKSLQMEKDVHAYLFCATYPGRTLVFVNAIACARSLAALLCTLGVKATPLHAQMQQRQRLRSLDRFTSDAKAVLVATDVAARGLDIPKVEHVVHYDAARSAEVFIHRAGRTARARAPGLSLSIVAPRDDANHRQICSVLGLHDGMNAFPVEVRLVDRARERVGMALKVLKFQHEQDKVSASNEFFRGLSKEADLILDGDVIVGEGPEGTSDVGEQGRVSGIGRKGNRHAMRLAAEARRALKVSLSRPLHVDRRKLIPVAQALEERKRVSERTAAGDLVGSQRESNQHKVS